MVVLNYWVFRIYNMKQFFLLDSYQFEEMKSIRRVSDLFPFLFKYNFVMKYKILNYKIFIS